MAQSGPLGGNGKAALLAIEMWRDNINARGGLLGRPVQLVYYDDQTNPALIPGIYSKLFDVDKVDLVLGGYGTAVQAAALPIVMQRKQVLIGTGAVAVNEKYKYDKYFQMLPNGSTARTSTSEGFFQAAMTMDPKPKTVAIVGAVTEFSRNVILGARENAKKYGLKDRLRRRISSQPNGIRIDPPLGPGGQPGSGLCRVVSAGFCRRHSYRL